jgi:outer membrane protein assembly factor BamB
MSLSPGPRVPERIRWWPLAVLLGLAALAVVAEWTADQPFQKRNLGLVAVGIGFAWSIFFWWIGASGAPLRLRWGVAGGFLLVLGLGVGSFRIRGVSGDLLPILEPRWRRSIPVATPAVRPGTNAVVRPSPGTLPDTGTAERDLTLKGSSGPEFPQFLGPERTGVVQGPALDTDWKSRPPQELWRKAVGAAWSGFVVSGGRAITQEQAGEQERVACYDAATGELLWVHDEPGRYFTTIAGEGPRATPAVAAGRVFALGALGTVQALDLATGRLLWKKSLREDFGASPPEWGYSGSPLVLDGRVVIAAGGSEGRALIAFASETGAVLWSGGPRGISYGSPFPATFAGVGQILCFGNRCLLSYDPATGQVLWQRDWGTGQPLVAAPVLAGNDRVMVSAGYGVGAELFRVDRAGDGAWRVQSEWVSKRLKAKFANPVRVADWVLGLDDGILAALDLGDGRSLWKEGRYGHGQGIWTGGVYLLLAESGELVALRPTRTGPGEVARIPVLSGKSWNPIALAGDRLWVRNDQEAVCLRLPLVP